MASSDLVNMGISVVSYTLKDIHNDQVNLSSWSSLLPSDKPSRLRIMTSASLPQDYLHSLGKARTAQVQKDARIGEAEAKRDAGIRVRELRVAWSPSAFCGAGGLVRGPVEQGWQRM